MSWTSALLEMEAVDVSKWSKGWRISVPERGVGERLLPRSAGIDLFEREDLAGELRVVGDELLGLVLSPVANGAGAVRSMLEMWRRFVAWSLVPLRMVEKRVARAVRRVAEVFEKRDEVDVDDVVSGARAL